MEQKTEASQAVDERALFEKAMNDQRFFPRELDFTMTKSPSGRDEYANAHLESCWLGWQARAALKAQPAPTEAQGEPYAWSYECRQPFTDPVMWAEIIGRDKPTKNDPKWTRNAKPLYERPAPTEAAQGEDSARLDAADLATIEEATKVLESAAKHNSLMGRTVFAEVQRNRAERLRAIIDRARASAETGGVKP